MRRHDPGAVARLDKHGPPLGEQQLRATMLVRGVQMPRGILVPDGNDRPRHLLDRRRPDMSDYDLILAHFDLLLKAAHSTSRYSRRTIHDMIEDKHAAQLFDRRANPDREQERVIFRLPEDRRPRLWRRRA